VEAIEKLIQAVQDVPMKSYVKKGLALKLWVARAVLRDSSTRNDHVAVKALCTFVRTVNALAGRKIPAETAAELTAAARDVIYMLENEVVDRCRGRDCWWDRRGDDDDDD
jgi:hypothetical protein